MILYNVHVLLIETPCGFTEYRVPVLLGSKEVQQLNLSIRSCFTKIVVVLGKMGFYERRNELTFRFFWAFFALLKTAQYGYMHMLLLLSRIRI